jgi:acetyl esterase/lipase
MYINPALFRTEAISEETRLHVAQLEHDATNAPPTAGMSLPELRELDRQKAVLSDRAKLRHIDGPGGQLDLRVFEPRAASVRAAYLHIHGGGWRRGSAYQNDAGNLRLADANGIAVVSVEYRLAPEHPYPAGPDDCEAAAIWLIEHAAAEFGTDRLLIGGESAGAHLSAVTLVRLRDRHGYTSFSGANLVYGIYDLAMTPSCANWGERALVISTPAVAGTLDHFVQGADRRDPDVSPLLADLRDMPPALFSVGTLDPLLDDSLFMAARWVAAGNQAELAVYPGAFHGFSLLAPDLDVSFQHDERVDRFFESVLTA